MWLIYIMSLVWIAAGVLIVVSVFGIADFLIDEYKSNQEQ
jgi:hypothetical protein